MSTEKNKSASAYWVTNPKQGEIRAEALNECQPNEVLVRMLYSGISRGTETTVWRGGVPESQYDRMRAPFQAGDFPFPVKYGYMAVGQVEEGESALIGKTVFCLHPHQSRFTIPRQSVTIVPENIPAARAILAANMETAVNATWDGLPRTGDKISVIGAGTVGCLTAWLLGQIPGTDVELIDLEPTREAIAEALGMRFSTPDNAAKDRDLVFHASGNPAGLVSALEIIGAEGSIVEMSWYGDKQVSLPLGEAFHDRRIKIISSQVGNLPADRRARWNHARRMQTALELLQDPVLDVLITGEDDFTDLPTVFEKLATARDALCHRIRY